MHERLNAIDAHGAPARVARILAGLGFDEDAQHRPLDAFLRRLAHARRRWPRCCSPSPICCCSTSRRTISISRRRCGSRPSCKSYRGSLIVVSHERDLLNNVVDHILHLERGKTTLYPGDYDAFERQRRERQAQAEAVRAKQEAKGRSCKPTSIAGATRRTPRARRRAA